MDTNIVQLIILILSVLATLSIGLFIYLKDTVSISNRIFGLLSFAWIGWTTVTYISLHVDDNQLFWVRLTMFFVILMNTLLWLVATVFPQRTYKLKKSERIKLYYALVTLAVSVSPLLFTKVIVSEGGSINPVPGPGMALFLLHVVIFALGGIAKLIKRYLHAKSLERAQLLLILYGSVSFITLVPTINFILPVVFKQTNLLSLSPVFTVIFASFIAYAIIKEKLFDIRGLVARSVTYVTLLVILTLLYIAAVFVVSSLIFPGTTKPTRGQLGVNISLAVLLAFSFQLVRRAVDKVTNKIFFRDAYDSQSVLNKIGDTIVGNISTHKIQRGAIEALEPALRPTYIAFLMLNSGGKLHLRGLKGENWQSKDSQSLQRTLARLSDRVTLYDDLDDTKQKQVKTTLRTEDINVVAPLVTKDGVIGYLVAGPKKSGDIYNRQDAGLLGIAANELAVALQNAQRFEEIQAFNITLQEKVTEATRELKQTNKKLIALDEAKDEFISMASHQLRTPLTSIKGYISMLLEGDLGKVNAAQSKALKEAFGSSQRMVYLIADFLNVSRIKTGKFMIETKEVDLPEIVREELTQLREMAGSRDLKLIYEQPEVFPRVKLDDNKIRQVMMNMVDNAIYYTPSGGKITIQLYSTGDEIIFKVVDSGIGVPKAEQHKLFTKFYRAGNARQSRPDGTGLGLFMAQKIIVEQGGAIIFESTEGKGSTFGWRFPLAKIKA